MINKLTLLNASDFTLPKVSIRHLTILGLSLVAIPLVVALLYTANKLSQLSKQSTETIFEVAQLIQLNSELTETLAKIERSASQYLVLKDDELKRLFNKHQRQLTKALANNRPQQKNAQLTKLLLALQARNEDIKALVHSDSLQTISLEQLQTAFKPLANINIAIKQHSKRIINEQANNIQRSGEQARNNIFKSLYIIPITLLIAICLFLLISKPLKRLIAKIQDLEQGNFKQEITFTGAIEFEEIAQALENMRKRLHTLELQKSSFIRHISHELKTPLAAIREGTELIYDYSVGPLNSEQQEICHIIKESTHRLQTLIEALLDFNIVLDSTSLHNAEKINFSQLLTKVIEQRQLDIKKKNIQLKCHGHVESLHSNATQLSVILENVLSNAIKHSPANGKITIESSLNDCLLLVTVTDQGPGISEAIQDKVFDAFYQGPAPQELSPDNTIKGSGLGLTIVKELLLRLNGSISISSPVNSQGGTKIVISLPQVIHTKNLSTSPKIQLKEHS